MLLSFLPQRAGRIASVLLLGVAAASAQPVISEFLASNGGTLDDEDGDSSDWIEIHNPGPGPVDLGGHTLTDDPLLPQKWTFPAPTNLDEGAYLLVFASGKDRAVAGEELHTNFAIEASGEYLALGDASGAVLDQFAPAFPEQRRDISYGRADDGSLAWLDPPTPGAANGPPLAGFVSDTIFSHKRGFYDGPISVAITSATPDALIRYTSNGSPPTPASGTLYTGPIAINATTVIRAIAYKPGMVPTNVDAQSYLFTSGIIRQSGMIQTVVNDPKYRGEIESSLRALPVVSLSFRHADLFGFAGIHSNPLLSGRPSEREAHFEYFHPADPDDSTHEPAGVRIHGGNSREHPKKNFRLYFRDDYGQSRLEHDLFPGSPVASFKHLLLRGGGHDAWTFSASWDQASLIRNEFLHRVQLAMSQPSPRGKFVSLFLNGQYWGVYELQELPHEEFNADHHGGDPEDWDVIKHGEEVEAGTIAAWDDLLARAGGGIVSGADYAAVRESVDIDNFADAMIHRIWSSDEDWLYPEYRNGLDISSFSIDKNWYVARKSRNGPGKFIFYCWDAEMSMGIPYSASRSYENDFTRVNTPNSPGILYDMLRRYPEFRLRFADRLHKHVFHDGALTTSNLRALWDPLVSEVRSPMVAESARWGLASWGGSRSTPFTRDAQWLPAVGWVRDEFLVHRTGTVFSQFRNIGLYPGVAAPEFSPPSGSASTGVQLTLTTATPGATIYYTTDGSDPRVAPEISALTLVPADHPVRFLVPNQTVHNQIGTTWRELADPANIAFWTSGENGVGFEGSPTSSPNFLDAIRTAIPNMRNINPSAYIRIKFSLPDQDTIDSIVQLVLRVRYDDGFIAYLNGVRIEEQNVIADNWNSAASASHADEQALNFENFDVSLAANLLLPGENVLAIHGLNRTATSDDFLIQAALEATTGRSEQMVSPAARTFTAPIPIARTTRIMTRARDAAGNWSALADVLYRIGTAADATNLRVTEIHYHPTDPATPAELAVSGTDNDFEFLELRNLRNHLLDLSLCRFERGIDFEFPAGTSLPANGHALLVSNLDAFLARYGVAPAAAILGEFANGTNLSNGGERLTLLDSRGRPIFDFQFSDRPPWPLEPDGGGPSLVLIDPPNTPVGNLGDANRWRAAFLDFGAPALADGMSFDLWTRRTYGPLDGTDPLVGGALVVPSGRGDLSNLALYAHGHDLSGGDPSRLSVIDLAEDPGSDYLALTFQLRDDLDDVVPFPEVSSDLVTWSPNVDIISFTDNGDGTSTFVVRDLVPVSSARERYIRLRFVKGN